MYEKLSRAALENGIAKLEASTKAFVDKPGIASEEEKAKFILQLRMLAAARLELSRRDAEINDLPF